VRERLPAEEEISFRILVLLGTESSHKIPNLEDSPLSAKKIWYPISQKLKKRKEKRKEILPYPSRNNPNFLLDQEALELLLSFVSSKGGEWNKLPSIK